MKKSIEEHGPAVDTGAWNAEHGALQRHVVFWIVRDSACAECGEVLHKGRFLRMESEQPLCLDCAGLGHLVLLPSVRW